MTNFSPATCNFYSLSDYEIPNFSNFNFARHKSWKEDQERYDQIARWAINILDEVGEYGEIAIEGYSMGSKGKVFNIAENTGVLKHEMWKRGWDIHIFPPTVIKKHATGKGNSDKTKMYDFWTERTKMDLKTKIQPTRKLGSPTTDLVDAFFICEYLGQLRLSPEA